jgi:hypothetical protein
MTPSMEETIQTECEKTAQFYAIASTNNYHYINLFSQLSPFNSTDIVLGQLCSDQTTSDEEEVQNNAPPEIIKETIKNDDKPGGYDLQVRETIKSKKLEQTPPPTSLDQKNSSPITALQLQWIRWNGTARHSKKGKKVITGVDLNPKWVAKKFGRKYMHKWIASKDKWVKITPGDSSRNLSTPPTYCIDRPIKCPQNGRGCPDSHEHPTENPIPRARN